MASNTGKNSAKATAPAEDKAEKPKRVNLTPAERIAKLEADLEAARNKASEKDRKRHAVLGEEITKLDTRIKDLQDKRDTARAEQVGIEARVPDLAPNTEAQAQVVDEPAEG